VSKQTEILRYAQDDNDVLYLNDLKFMSQSAFANAMAQLDKAAKVIDFG